MVTEKQILKVQAERWARLRKFHNYQVIDLRTRHFFMKKHIEMLREGKRLLAILRQYSLN